MLAIYRLFKVQIKADNPTKHRSVGPNDVYNKKNYFIYSLNNYKFLFYFNSMFPVNPSDVYHMLLL